MHRLASFAAFSAARSVAAPAVIIARDQSTTLTSPF